MFDKSVVTMIALVLLLYGSPAWSDPTFTPLGYPGDSAHSSIGNFSGLSGDGRALIVRGHPSTEGPLLSEHIGEWRWNAADGFLPPLRDLAGGQRTFATDISFDGLYAIGYAARPPSTPFDPGDVSAIWIDGVAYSVNDHTELPWARAWGVSDDGERLFGAFDSLEGSSGNLWTRVDGAVQIQWIPGADAMSSDGSTIFGIDADGPFRWTDETGVVLLEDARSEGCRPVGNMYIVSSDGGAASDIAMSFSSDPHFYRWTPASGLECIYGFVPLPGDDPGTRYDVSVVALSDDGAVVAGVQFKPLPPPEYWIARSFVWEEETGVEYIDEMLSNAGVEEIGGWSRLFLAGMSHDGRVLAGWGLAPDGRNQAFVIHRWFEREDLEVEIGWDFLVWLLFHEIEDPIEAAVFGSNSVDVGDIVPDTLALQRAGAPLLVGDERPRVHHIEVRDVDEDGHDDLLAYFSGEEAGVSPFDRDVCLRGLIGEEMFEACNDVRPFFAWCGRGFEWALIPVVAVALHDRSRRRKQGGTKLSWMRPPRPACITPWAADRRPPRPARPVA